MRVDSFNAKTDLVALRLKVGWTLWLDPGETLADAPPLRLRRKTRDFEFPPWVVDDPYLVYDSLAFPPAQPGLVVTDLPGWEVEDNGERTVHEVVSVAEDADGRMLERIRRTTSTTFDLDGQMLRRRVEILDTGTTPLSLQPLVPYYYQLESPGLSAVQARALRATATPGAAHGLNRTLFDMLPGLHQKHDVIVRPVTPGSETVPEAAARSGQLRRFLDVFGAALDMMRSSAEGLWSLRDIDAVDARHLPLIAQWLGWRLGDADAIPLARNELKATSRLYASVGTVTGLRSMVTRYSGWTTQVAEFAQHLLRSNDLPHWNLSLSRADATGWAGVLDVAERLGFDPGNRYATGTASGPATITGTLDEPFALFEGAELSLSLDDAPPFRIRLGTADFADIGNASALEVATAVGRAVAEIHAEDVAGRLRLSTRRIGAEASIDLRAEPADPLTLDAASEEPPTAALDTADRLWVVSATASDTADPSDEATPTYSGGLVCKAFAYGRWYGSHQLPLLRSGGPHRYPGSAALADGRVLLAWIGAADTANARLHYTLLTPAQPQPAWLQGNRHGPFRLFHGGRLSLRVGEDSDSFIADSADFADIQAATAAELVGALNAQLLHAVASVAGDGTVRLTSIGTGPHYRVRVDLAQSTLARRLGLIEAVARAGHWEPTPVLGPALPVPVVAPGRLRGTTAGTLPHGGVRMVWSRHRNRRWDLEGAAWRGPVALLATSAGLAIRSADGAVTVFDAVSGLPSSDVRHALTDADGHLWVATDAGVAWQRDDGAWVVVDSGDGLAGDDCRHLAQGPDGSVWVAGSSGVSRIAPDGSIAAFTQADGLSDDQARRIAVGISGDVWVATAAGLSRYAGGHWSAAPVAPGLLPSDDVNDVQLGLHDEVLVATALGAIERDAEGGWTTVHPPPGGGLPVQSMTRTRAGLWLATATGVWRRNTLGHWRHWSPLDGLPAASVSHLAPDGDGESVWLATTAGAAHIDTQGRLLPVGPGEGLPAAMVAGVAGPWSAVVGLTADGTGNHEPCLVRESTGTELLVWSRTGPDAPGQDHRLLWARRFDPSTRHWGAPQPLTSSAPGERASDRQPALLANPGGGARLFFSSDRDSGRRLWEADIAADLTPGTPSVIDAGPGHRIAPIPLRLPDGQLLLLHRSDAGVFPGHLSPWLAGATLDPHSGRLAEAATLRRFAGSTSVQLDDAARLSRRHQWGDLCSYTPHRPIGNDEPPIGAHEFYTRGTLGLYVSRGRHGRPLTSENAARLQRLLQEFVPINLRVVLILAPSVTVEHVYSEERDLEDSFLDVYPFAETLGAIEDSHAAALPGWAFLLSNEEDSPSADPTDLATLRRRSYFPPPL